MTLWRCTIGANHIDPRRRWIDFVDVGTTGRHRSRHCVTTADDHLYEVSIITQIRLRRDQLRRRHGLVATGSSTVWWSRCRQSKPASNQWGDEPTPRDTAVDKRPAVGEQQRRFGDWVERRRAGQPDGGGPYERWLMLLTVSCRWFCHPRLIITFRDIAETDGGDAVIFVQIEIKTQRSLGPLT